MMINPFLLERRKTRLLKFSQYSSNIQQQFSQQFIAIRHFSTDGKNIRCPLVYPRLNAVGQFQVHAYADYSDGGTEHIAMQLYQYACHFTEIEHDIVWPFEYGSLYPRGFERTYYCNSYGEAQTRKEACALMKPP